MVRCLRVGSRAALHGMHWSRMLEDYALPSLAFQKTAWRLQALVVPYMMSHLRPDTFEFMIRQSPCPRGG
jgi:hypothetical protein